MHNKRYFYDSERLWKKKIPLTESFNFLDTQDLTYSVSLSSSELETDLSSDEEVSDEESSDEKDNSTSGGDESIPDLSALNPYGF